MDKKVITVVKLELRGGHATPAPPVGPALGRHEVNIGQFCRQFNNQTEEKYGQALPVVVNIYSDKSFSFVVKQPTTTYLLKEAAGLYRGSGRPNAQKVGSVTQEELKRIAKIKMPDLNTQNLEDAMKMIQGTAKSMGIEITD